MIEQQSAWEKLEAFVNEVKNAPTLQKVFLEGTQAEKLAVLHSHGFSEEDLQTLADGGALLSPGTARDARGFWLW